jgi:hypothetical protein
MKKIIVPLFLVALSIFINNNAQAAQTKVVCATIKVSKSKKQNCKTIKIHRKLEGTRVPEKKK